MDAGCKSQACEWFARFARVNYVSIIAFSYWATQGLVCSLINLFFNAQFKNNVQKADFMPMDGQYLPVWFGMVGQATKRCVYVQRKCSPLFLRGKQV